MKGDLVVIVADGGIEQAIRGILTRPQALGIRPLQNVTFPKLKELDAGTYSRARELASLYKDTHTHAIVIFDLAWDGCPSDDPNSVERDVETDLVSDWDDRGRCVVISPELEAWVWSDSPHVARTLGWSSVAEMKSWLVERGFWKAGDVKPSDPKQAYLAAIREKKVETSNSNFKRLATQVSLSRCQDRAFLRLREILSVWFGVDPTPP